MVLNLDYLKILVININDYINYNNEDDDIYDDDIYDDDIYDDDIYDDDIYDDDIYDDYIFYDNIFDNYINRGYSNIKYNPNNNNPNNNNPNNNNLNNNNPNNNNPNNNNPNNNNLNNNNLNNNNPNNNNLNDNNLNDNNLNDNNLNDNNPNDNNPNNNNPNNNNPNDNNPNDNNPNNNNPNDNNPNDNNPNDNNPNDNNPNDNNPNDNFINNKNIANSYTLNTNKNEIIDDSLKLKEKKEFEWNDIVFKSEGFDYSYFFTYKMTKQLNYDYWLRFEFFCLEINDEESYYYDYVKKRLLETYCVGMSKHLRWLMFIYVKFATSSYKGIRHFMGLPVRGNRTWSNRRNPRKNQEFVELCHQIYFPRRLGYFNRSKKKAVFYAEFLNKLYYIFFRIDWMRAKVRRVKYIKKGSHLEWRFDLKSLVANKVLIYDEKKEKKIKRNKKKKQKKKYKIKKHFFNLGFDFNFTRSREIEKKMFKQFFVVKRSFIPKKKKKKKK